MTFDRTFEADVIREITGNQVTTTYVALGSALSEPVYILWLFNSTNATVFISEDGSNNHYRLLPGSNRTIDLQANKADQRIGAKGAGVQFYVKGINGALPDNGYVWIEGQIL